MKARTQILGPGVSVPFPGVHYSPLATSEHEKYRATRQSGGIAENVLLVPSLGRAVSMYLHIVVSLGAGEAELRIHETRLGSQGAICVILPSLGCYDHDHDSARPAHHLLTDLPAQRRSTPVPWERYHRAKAPPKETYCRFRFFLPSRAYRTPVGLCRVSGPDRHV